MKYVKARANEYLVVARGGRLVDRGIGGSAFVWSGSGYALVPSTKQEASFAMTQETREGIPLRFKGIVIYRVTRPELSARLFDFTRPDGHDQIKSMIGHVCLGELRAAVAHMTMDECIEERKTTLTEAVATSLARVVGAGDPAGGWGIGIDVVQVAQVFIIDDDLRRKLESEKRDRIRAMSELSKIRTDRDLEQERLRSEAHRAEADAPVRLLRIRKDAEVLGEELLMRRLENQVRELRVQGELLHAKAEQDLRLEILPLEQSVEIARALSSMFQGTNLSIYGNGSEIVSMLGPMVQLVSDRLRDALAR